VSAATELRPALEKAAIRRFLYIALCPPRPGHQEDLRAIAAELPKGEFEGVKDLLTATDDEVAAEGFRLIGPAGVVPITSSNYIEDGYADKGPKLGDAAGFHKAFDFTATLSESPDHFATIFEFLSFLALKEAWESADGDESQAELCRDAEAKFLTEHVTPYLPRFAERLAAASPPGGHHAALARVLTQVG
jgi:hypothetical protein